MNFKRFGASAFALALALGNAAPAFAQEAEPETAVVETAAPEVEEAPTVTDVTPEVTDAPVADPTAEADPADDTAPDEATEDEVPATSDEKPAVEDTATTEEEPSEEEAPAASEKPANDAPAVPEERNTAEETPAVSEKPEADPKVEDEQPNTEDTSKIDQLIKDNSLFDNASQGENGDEDAKKAAEKQAADIIKDQGYVIPDGASVVIMGTGEGYTSTSIDRPVTRLSHDGSVYDITTIAGGEYQAGQPIIVILQKTGPDGKVEYLVHQGIVEKMPNGTLGVRTPNFADVVSSSRGDRYHFRETYVRVVKKEADGAERIIWLNKAVANNSGEKKSPNTSVE